MTQPTPETFPLGPGTLTIGATGAEIDVSCLINNAVLAADKEQGDSETKLCGTVVPGSVTYTWTLSGNVDLDIATESGLWDLSVTSPGSQQEFTYTPNTDAGTSGEGTLVIDPLPLGGDETGTTMAADFEWAVVGVPTFTITPPVGMASETPAMAGSSASSGSGE
jgi:hypothetical protein